MYRTRAGMHSLAFIPQKTNEVDAIIITWPRSHTKPGSQSRHWPYMSPAVVSSLSQTATSIRMSILGIPKNATT